MARFVASTHLATHQVAFLALALTGSVSANGLVWQRLRLGRALRVGARSRVSDT